MTYQVIIQKRVFKILDKINDPDHYKIRAAIQTLASNPFPNGHKKLKGRPGYRIRVGVNQCAN